MGRVGSYKLGSNTGWTNKGNLTTAEAALAADEMDTATADKLINTIKFVAIGNPYAVLLRVRSDGTEDDSNVIQIYQAKDADYYSRVAQLTCLQGAAQYADTYFTDSITPAEENPILDGEESLNTLADQIGTYYWRTLGNNKFLITVSTLTSTTVYVDARFLYE